MATSKLNARRPASRGVADARDAGGPAAPAPPPAPAGRTVAIDLAPSPDAGQGLTLKQQASALAVVDRASHEHALEFVRGAKQLKRKIEDHWSRITRGVDDLKRNLLDLKRRDIEPIDLALAVAEQRVVTFVAAEQKRQREEEDRQRRANEEQARQARERELAEQEAEAERLEAQSPRLSEREAAYVEAVLAHGDTVKAAKYAGYKDPPVAAGKLRVMPKILDAIASRQAASAVRQQAEAVRQQPLDVEAPKVESNLGKVSGTRIITTYSCEVVDPDALRGAVILGSADRRAVTPDLVFLNQQAKQLRDSFESCFPGCRLVKRTGVAG